jgi:hypothetical protein
VVVLLRTLVTTVKLINTKNEASNATRAFVSGAKLVCVDAHRGNARDRKVKAGYVSKAELADKGEDKAAETSVHVETAASAAGELCNVLRSVCV